MNCYRFLVVALIAFSFGVRPAFSQVAVEPRPETSEEPATVEPSPVPTGEPVVETKESSEKKPAKKSRKKPVDTDEEQSSRVLQDAMTAQEFKAAGLEKLSNDELKNLNDWLQGYRHTAEAKAAEKATAETTKKVQAQTHIKIDQVESRVDGTVPHLTGHSIIKLEDGTVWKQANADDRYPSPNIDHPNAIVKRSAFGWKMQISGLPEFYVNQVHTN